MSMIQRAECIDGRLGADVIKYRLLHARIINQLHAHVHSGLLMTVPMDERKLLSGFGIAHRIAQEAFFEASMACAKYVGANVNNVQIIYNDGIDEINSMVR